MPRHTETTVQFDRFFEETMDTGTVEISASWLLVEPSVKFTYGQRDSSPSILYDILVANRLLAETTLPGETENDSHCQSPAPGRFMEERG
jgi:hypothetical protein